MAVTERGWKCPDCCVDLDAPVLHPVSWRFCPFTGRPRGVLHVTPNTLQSRFTDLLVDAEEAGVSDLVIGFIATQLQAVRDIPSSYMRGSPHYIIAPDTDLGRLGEDLAEICERRLEIRDHLGDLLTGDRGTQRYDGQPVPALGGRLKD